MKHITFYFDFISPYAFLAFEKLPDALAGHSYWISYEPVLFAGLLKHHGQLGPAEIPVKRDWTYRQVSWLAHQQGTPFLMPDGHPFNPLPMLRLAWACAGNVGEGAYLAGSTPNRFVCESIFRQVWQTGHDAGDVEQLESLARQLQPRLDVADAWVKKRLKDSTDNAIAGGVFGVPSYRIDDKLFWGLDALPMLRAYLDAEPWFSSSAWQDAADVPVGKART
jgi:2-hydroxychromene-2-carboxylate isomerase